VLIDYKISTIKEDSDLVKAYKTQLDLYAHALEKILKVKVKAKYIINVLKENVISV
jgi:ATP-dependent exoDNAse (exonuclease V) beta subunit